MKETRRKELLAGIVLLAAFALWTVLIRHIDIQNAGPNGTEIGFAAINVWFHRLTGVHMLIYTITDWLGLVPIIICICFGVQKHVEGRFRYPAAGSLLRGGNSGIPVVRDGADQLQTDPDRWKSGSIISVINYTSGPDCDADIEVSIRPKNYESSDTESDNGICNRIRGIYGYRKTDRRRPLGNGYCRLRFPELRSVYDLSVHGRLFCLKQSDSEDGGIRWSSMRSYRNYEKVDR